MKESRTEKDRSCTAEERAEREYYVSADDVLADLKVHIAEQCCGECYGNGDRLYLLFSNGQRFILSLREVN